MEWEYLGAFDQNGVNFHIWSARDDNNEEVYALTRTSVIAPQRPVTYRSFEEIAEKNKFQLAPAPQSKPPPNIPVPPDPDKPHGLFRRPGGWVEVNFLHSVSPLPKSLYEKGGYWPEYSLLPTAEEYQAAKQLQQASPAVSD